MSNFKIILSGGSIPWLGIKESLSYSKNTGYDGLEVLPTRKVVSDIENAIRLFGKDRWTKYFKNLDNIYSIHQNWRLDITLDKQYKINLLWSLFFTITRILLFPNINKSKRIIEIISEKFNLPVTVHDISSKWTNCEREFSGGILYEIIGTKRKPEEIKIWLREKQHKIVLDTRDDQSYLWAKKYGFKNWKSFWEWLGLKNIGGFQLTLIGASGLKRILTHKLSVAEEQFIWLHKHNWQGIITVEVNTLMLFILTRGRVKEGLRTIADFVKQTIGEGRSWTN